MDWTVTLRLDRDEDVFEASINQPFVIVAADGVETRLDPENDVTGLGPVLSCVRTAITRATAFDDGRLEILFADGSVIRVPVSPDYEAWDFSGPAGLLVVSLPGGELAIWGAKDSTPGART